MAASPAVGGLRTSAMWALPDTWDGTGYCPTGQPTALPGVGRLRVTKLPQMDAVKSDWKVTGDQVIVVVDQVFVSISQLRSRPVARAMAGN